MIEPWEIIESEEHGDYRIFRVLQNHSRSQKTGHEFGFYVIDAADWINVIPVTPEGEIVFVRQYRHGTQEVTLEVPGGIVDDGDESPAAAARREMIEETGYDSDALIALGDVAPNPAMQSNQCYTYLAPNAHKQAGQQLDRTEEIEVVLVQPERVPDLIRDGQVSHALVVAAFYLYEQYRRHEEDGGRKTEWLSG